MEASLARAAATISELKAQGRLEDAELLEKQVAEIAEKAQIALAPDNEAAKAVKELSMTTQMIGEHLSTGCLKDGEINKGEGRNSRDFFEKCIPMLELQTRMVKLTSI